MVLTAGEGETLVRVARSAIETHLLKETFHAPSNISSALRERRGVFVTISDSVAHEDLKGCIGIPFPTDPLIDQVRVAAIGAATEDPRFRPLSLEELKKRTVVEVTVLSEMEPIWVKNPLDLRDNISVGRDGIMVEGMGSHGLLLPQVAVDEGFDSEEFLSQCCLKADLPPDAWLTGEVRVSRFQGQVFSEDAPHGRVFERNLDRRVPGERQRQNRVDGRA